jgi:hypothetical protein
MITDDVARELHDKATRGLGLSAAEQAQLDAWYAQQDAEESAALAEAQPSQSLASLRARVNGAMSELLIIVQENQAQAAEHEKIRREIGELQRQLIE